MSTATNYSEKTKQTCSVSGSRNVGEEERWISALAGAAMVGAGLARCSLSGLGLALLGGALVQRGWSGHCAVYEMLGIDSASPTSTCEYSL